MLWHTVAIGHSREKGHLGTATSLAQVTEAERVYRMEGVKKSR